MDKIFSNAIDSIEMGVEDFQSPHIRRVLSSVRNVHSGVLLLCKTVLSRGSQDTGGSLIYAKMEPVSFPNGDVVWQPNKTKTVDVQELKARFKLLKRKLDWAKLDELTQHRNTIEHLHFSVHPEVLKEVLANAFLLINEIMRDHIGCDPEREFSPSCWGTLLENAAVFTEIKKECAASFVNLEWPSEAIPFPVDHLKCTVCPSSLIKQQDSCNTTPSEIEFACRACGHDNFDNGQVMEAALDAEAAGLLYLAMTDGGEPPLAHCHDCGRFTYVVDAGECIVCSHALPIECSVCGDPISPNDYNPEYPGLCGYHANRWQKVERE